MQEKSALVIYKQDQHDAQALAEEISVWLSKSGIAPLLCEADSPLISPLPPLTLVLGGDGTILGVARKLAGSKSAILGINFGRVGFLTACAPADWESILSRAIAGNLESRSCLALKWRVARDGAEIKKGVAINDVVVARGCLARLTSISVAINSQELGVVRADGIIVSSPLGSSGYAASAGAPMVFPDLDVTTLATICAFMPPVCPLVLPGNAEFKLTVLDFSGDCYLTIDGQEGETLEKRDQIIVNGWPDAIHFLGEKSAFFSRLKTRAFNLAPDNL